MSTHMRPYCYILCFAAGILAEACASSPKSQVFNIPNTELSVTMPGIPKEITAIGKEASGNMLMRGWECQKESITYIVTFTYFPKDLGNQWVDSEAMKTYASGWLKAGCAITMEPVCGTFKDWPFVEFEAIRKSDELHYKVRSCFTPYGICTMAVSTKSSPPDTSSVSSYYNTLVTKSHTSNGKNVT